MSQRIGIPLRTGACVLRPDRHIDQRHRLAFAKLVVPDNKEPGFAHGVVTACKGRDFKGHFLVERKFLDESRLRRHHHTRHLDRDLGFAKEPLPFDL